MKRNFALYAAFVLGAFALASLAMGDDPPVPEAPIVAGESNEGEQAIAGFKLPDGWRAELFAAEPLVANPVGFCVDARGRVYVCESFRQGKGIEDNRNHPEWLEDDLAAQTVADRLAYIKRHLGEKASDYERYDDRIRRLVDRDGDGRADEATVFADRFNNIVDGTGSSVLAYRGRVYYTCIPHLWSFTDADDDGVSDSRLSLHEGYGVRFAFRGHDLHGLTIGPDGRLYFSVGDRGYNVTTSEGRRLADPESGAVFACELDGSKLEAIATGLRNPQDLAFDDFGNLFTGDNNSDSGDKARWVYVVPGGDSGWRMSYQYLPDRGPFNRERLWHPFHERQPAYIVPPVTNLADGPSGLAYYPGTGMSEHFAGRFFLCDFRGGAANSGVRTFRVKPVGAFFEVVDQEESLWNMLATDVEFGPDGLYVSDWVHGWNGEGKGRIYRFVDKEAILLPAAVEVKKLLAEGFADRDEDELAMLLRHPDRRVRQEAQFALVDGGAAERLAQVAAESESTLARLHALWGLGQLGRRGEALLDGLQTGLALLADEDAEIRAQATKLLGEIRAETASVKLIERLRDDNARVRYFAALALGGLGDVSATGPLLELLAANDNRDPIVRHGAIMGLVGAASDQGLIEAAKHPSSAARLGVVVAMRKRSLPQVAKLLGDPVIAVAEETARAIYDSLPASPIAAAALPELAESLSRETDSPAFLSRALHANYRLGGADRAAAIAAFAAREAAPIPLRVEALELLAAWESPPKLDRLLGMYRPLPQRESGEAREALRASLGKIVAGPAEVRLAAAKAAATMGIEEIAPTLLATFNDRSQAGAVRSESLAGLAALDRANIQPVLEMGLADSDSLVRAVARRVLAKTDPERAAKELAKALDASDCAERQAALAALATLEDDAADSILVEACQRLLAGKIPADTRLDVIEAAKQRSAPELTSLVGDYLAKAPKDGPSAPSAAYADSLVGGDAERGRALFFARGELSCVRCHIIQDQGGEVGPNLSKIGADKTREYLFESLVLPSKSIAKGYESVHVITDDGRVRIGILKKEDDSTLQLMTPEGQTISIPKETIEERAAALSAMPEDLYKKLTPLELRDLIEFLAKQK